MRRCIVHFGMPKTGSTSIQASLLAAGTLPQAHYLNVGHKNSGRVLATMFLDDPRDFHLNRKWNLELDTLTQARQEAFASFARQFQAPRDLFILSGEAISSMDATSLGRMRDWLLGHVDEVQAVGYVRKPRGYMESELQQKIKAGRGRFDLASHYPGYRDRFTPLEQVFGRAQVRYWLFDPASFPGKDVVRDFAARLGLGLPESALQRSNESLSLEGARLLYIYRKLGEGYGQGQGMVEENRRLSRLLREVPGPKLRIAHAAAQAVIDAQADDMAWMAERLQASLDEPAGADEQDVVAEEADLLRPTLATLAWLAGQLGRPAPQQMPPLQVVADSVQALRQQLGQALHAHPRRYRSQLVTDTPALHHLDAASLSALIAPRLPPAARAAAPLEVAVAASLQALHSLLTEATEQPREVAGLGRFHLRRRDRKATSGQTLVFEPEGADATDASDDGDAD